MYSRMNNIFVGSRSTMLLDVGLHWKTCAGRLLVFEVAPEKWADANEYVTEPTATHNESAIATEYSAASSREDSSQLLQSTDAYKVQEAVRSPTVEAPATATEQSPAPHFADGSQLSFALVPAATPQPEMFTMADAAQIRSAEHVHKGTCQAHIHGVY